jgi:hypothetical protein
LGLAGIAKDQVESYADSGDIMCQQYWLWDSVLVTVDAILPQLLVCLGFRLAFHVREGLRLLRAERDWFHRADGCDRCEVREGRSIA